MWIVQLQQIYAHICTHANNQLTAPRTTRWIQWEFHLKIRQQASECDSSSRPRLPLHKEIPKRSEKSPKLLCDKWMGKLLWIVESHCSQWCLMLNPTIWAASTVGMRSHARIETKTSFPENNCALKLFTSKPKLWEISSAHVLDPYKRMIKFIVGWTVRNRFRWNWIQLKWNAIHEIIFMSTHIRMLWTGA